MSNILQKLKDFRRSRKKKKILGNSHDIVSTKVSNENPYEKNYSDINEKQINKDTKENELNKEKEEAINKLEEQLVDKMARKEKEINNAIEKAYITNKSLTEISNTSGWMEKQINRMTNTGEEKKLQSEYINIYNKITYVLNLDLEQIKYEFDKKNIMKLDFSGDDITINELYYSIKYGKIDTNILLNINNIINKINNIVVEYLYCKDKTGCLNNGSAIFNLSSLINVINEQITIITNNLTGTWKSTFNTLQCIEKKEIFNTLSKTLILSVKNAFQEYFKIPSNPELLLNLNLSDIQKVLKLLISNIHCIEFDIDRDEKISEREKKLQQEITLLFESINDLITNIINNKQSIHDKVYIIKNIDNNIELVRKTRELNIKKYNINKDGGKKMNSRNKKTRKMKLARMKTKKSKKK